MDEREEFIGTHEAADIMGCHPEHVRRLCRQKKMPYYQTEAGGHYRFLASEIYAYLRGEWSRERGWGEGKGS